MVHQTLASDATEAMAMRWPDNRDGAATMEHISVSAMDKQSEFVTGELFSMLASHLKASGRSALDLGAANDEDFVMRPTYGCTVIRECRFTNYPFCDVPPEMR